MDSRWSPCGVRMDFKQNDGLKSFLDDGVQMESIWNLWGSVKYRQRVANNGQHPTNKRQMDDCECLARMTMTTTP